MELKLLVIEMGIEPVTWLKRRDWYLSCLPDPLITPKSARYSWVSLMEDLRNHRKGLNQKIARRSSIKILS